MRWKPSIRNGPTGTNLPMTGGIRGIFEQKYQSADDVYSQFGYFGRGKGCVDGGSPFLKGVYLFGLAKRYGGYPSLRSIRSLSRIRIT